MHHQKIESRSRSRSRSISEFDINLDLGRSRPRSRSRLDKANDEESFQKLRSKHELDENE